MPVLYIFPLLHTYAAKGCVVASLAEGTAVLLMQCPLLAMAGIMNLAMVQAIARQLFVNGTMGIYDVQTSTEMFFNSWDGSPNTAALQFAHYHG